MEVGNSFSSSSFGSKYYPPYKQAQPNEHISINTVKGEQILTHCCWIRRHAGYAKWLDGKEPGRQASFPFG